MRPEKTERDIRLQMIFKDKSSEATSPASKRKHNNKEKQPDKMVSNKSSRELVVVEDSAATSTSPKEGSWRSSRRSKRTQEKDATGQYTNTNNNNGGITVNSSSESHREEEAQEQNTSTNPTSSSSSPTNHRKKGTEREQRLTDDAVLQVFEKHLQDQSIIQSSKNQSIVIRDVVRKKLFRHVKFLSEDMLNVDGEVCNFVLTEIGRLNDKAKYRYNLWMTIKPVIKHAINTKRTSVSMIVKERFLSKFRQCYPSGNHIDC